MAEGNAIRGDVTFKENYYTMLVEEENTPLSQLKPEMKKAFLELRCKVEDAILGNYIMRWSKRACDCCTMAVQDESQEHGTDVVHEAFEMLQNTLKWRKEYKMDGILDETYELDIEMVGKIDGKDKEGRPLLYVVYGAIKDITICHKLLPRDEKKEDFLRWRIQFTEKAIQSLPINYFTLYFQIIIRRSFTNMYIALENLPVKYGGLKRDDDAEFSPEDHVSELVVRKGVVDSIQIPITEPGVTVVWDLTVVGGDVSYKEEFVPDDEGSYTISILKEKELEANARGSYYVNEPGKILTIHNGSFKKKRVFYRLKTKPAVSMYVS
ncbi:hypothetical protein GIB67_026858 [Kingdonia uniflora]|uniref:GOLD domain-containing protein n=1 Tax=Kingdonia uniflora TaxID=39325 RepID=A0A7J7M7R8_9MAGN|nr:hypothetical protein GIB67_026858 [Kingdonia uniflora]